MNHRVVLTETDLFVLAKIFILLPFVFLSSTQILDDVNTFGGCLYKPQFLRLA